MRRYCDILRILMGITGTMNCHGSEIMACYDISGVNSNAPSINVCDDNVYYLVYDECVDDEWRVYWQRFTE